MQSMKMLQFKISLAYIKPPVWRRFLVPSTFTFGDLHEVIQRVMGWTDSHLHEFDLDEERIGMKDEDSPPEVKDENRIRLNSRLKQPGRPFHYTYDFGDDWEHVVVLEEIAERSLLEAVRLKFNVRGSQGGGSTAVRGRKTKLSSGRLRRTDPVYGTAGGPS